MDAGRHAQASESSIYRARRLLRSIDNKVVENKQQIADMSVMGWQDLNDAGIRMGLLDLMDDANDFLDGFPAEFGTPRYQIVLPLTMAAIREAHGVR